MKKVTSNHVSIWTPSTFPPETAKKIVDSKFEFMLDTGAACSILNYRTFLEIAQSRQPIIVVRSKQKTKTYTGDIVPMIGHTTLSFSFDSDGEHQLELKIWITETQTSNLLGLNFADNTFRNCNSRCQQ